MRKKTVIWVVIAIGLIAGWAIGVDNWYRSVEPAGATLAEHRAKRPTYWLADIAVVDEKEYLLLYGDDYPWFPSFPSGPPLYVFDITGKMVDWSPDSGDALDEFRQRWFRNGTRKATSAEVDNWGKAAQ